jgi:hypothetical protein
VFVPGEGDAALSWEDLAGYESLRDEIEGTVVLALQVCDDAIDEMYV